MQGSKVQKNLLIRGSGEEVDNIEVGSDAGEPMYMMGGGRTPLDVMKYVCNHAIAGNPQVKTEEGEQEEGEDDEEEEDEGEKDAVKAGRGGPGQSSGRRGDNLKNGDKFQKVK